MQSRTRVAASVLTMVVAGAVTWAILNSQLPACLTSTDRFQHLNCLEPAVELWRVILVAVLAGIVAWTITGKVSVRPK